MKVAGEEIRRELERKGMQPADTAVSGMETQESGVLIGGDHYWEIESLNHWLLWTVSLDGSYKELYLC